MHRNDDATRSSPEFSKNRSQNGGRPRKYKLPHTGGRPTPLASPFDAVDDEHSNDKHASEGEGVEGADDEALEAEGPVLDYSPKGDNDFIDVVPPEWNSGDGLELEPHGTFRPLPPFNGIKGPDLGHLPREFCEFHLFFMLFPLDLIDHIVSETNMYAKKERVRCGSLHDSMRRWVPIDRHSFLHFMGIALGMALHYMPSKRHYWKDEMVSSLVFPNFGKKMSQTTFQKIKRFLHLRDNAQRPPRGSREHKLWQLAELEERLNYTFQKHYNVEKCVTVDERIIHSKCKLNPCRVYNPKEPHKFGIQVWNLCDSTTGYSYAFQIYDKLPCPKLSFHAVTGLVNSLERKGHHVFFDRFFTSVKLLEHLLSESQGGIGTYVANQKYFPHAKMLHLGTKDRGAFRFAYCKKQGILACSWMDKKEILFASNCYEMQKGEVKRLVSGGQRMLVVCPDVAVQYYACKVGCDTFDSMVLGSGYSSQTMMHGFKWWHAGFWGLMDFVFTNCWIIWKDFYGKRDVSRFDFLLHMHEQLVNNAFWSYVCKRPVVEDAYNGHFPVRLHDVASRYCVVCSAKRKKLMSEHKEVEGYKPFCTIWGCGVRCGIIATVAGFKLVFDVILWFQGPIMLMAAAQAVRSILGFGWLVSPNSYGFVLHVRNLTKVYNGHLEQVFVVYGCQGYDLVEDG
ncbi:hypothetical protein L7F22_008024 [Adiantum nelumboides]|nr:hypothetical protein [Adiantum nelumboides]